MMKNILEAYVQLWKTQTSFPQTKSENDFHNNVIMAFLLINFL